MCLMGAFTPPFNICYVLLHLWIDWFSTIWVSIYGSVHISITLSNNIHNKVIIIYTQRLHRDVLNILKHAFSGATMWSVMKSISSNGLWLRHGSLSFIMVLQLLIFMNYQPKCKISNNWSHGVTIHYKLRLKTYSHIWRSITVTCIVF